MAPTQRAHGEVWHKPDVKAAAEWRRRAAAKLEAERAAKEEAEAKKLAKKKGKSA